MTKTDETYHPISGSTTPEIFMKKGSCFFFHKWTRWSKRTRQMQRYYTEQNRIFHVEEEIQERVCLKCGKYQREILY